MLLNLQNPSHFVFLDIPTGNIEGTMALSCHVVVTPNTQY